MQWTQCTLNGIADTKIEHPKRSFRAISTVSDKLRTLTIYKKRLKEKIKALMHITASKMQKTHLF